MNKIALRKWAIFAARGDSSSMFAALGFYAVAFTLVGTIGFTAVSSKLVGTYQYREHGQEISKVAADAKKASAASDRIKSILKSVQDDGRGIISCEISNGCASGRAGRGVIVSQLNQLDGRLESLDRRFTQGGTQRDRLIEELRTEEKNFETRLNGDGKVRPDLISIDARVRNLLTKIRETMPVQAALSFAGELREMASSFPNRGQINVAAKLRSHADKIEATINHIKVSKLELQAFPMPPGLTSGWKHIDQTWPLAIFAYLLEAAAFGVWLAVYREYVAYYESMETDGGSSGEAPLSKDNPPVSNIQPEAPLEGENFTTNQAQNTPHIVATKHRRKS